MRKIVPLAGLLCCLAAPAAFSQAEPPSSAPDAYASLTQLETLSEVMRHLYRWYLDEGDFADVHDRDAVTFRICPLALDLDEGDRSLYADILIPWLKVSVRMKQTDYRIEELDLEVKSRSFKIVNVARWAQEAPPSDEERRVAYPVKDLMAYLFRTRTQPDFPSAELSVRLRKAIAAEIYAYLEGREQEEDQVLFVAPMSPVANEIYVFWENAETLVRWASDIEMDNPAVWEHERLSTRFYDIEEQVVLSFAEAPGSNAYLTRDQVGRALYNCIILGQKRVVQLETLRERLREDVAAE